MGYTHGIQWTKEKAINDILKIKEELELDRMPTLRECDDFTGNRALSSYISKNYGFYELAKELNLPIKSSETTLGKRIEGEIKDLLISKGYKVERMPQNYAYDLLINDYIKIDVKSSHFYEDENRYRFRTNKPYSTCDIYILAPLDKKHEFKDIYIVPSPYVANCKNEIDIRPNSIKFEEFKNNYHMLNKYIEIYGGV